MQKIIVVITLLLASLLSAAQPNIVQAEYYIDTDPGFGNGTNISVANAVNVTDQSFPVLIGALQEGSHGLFIRTKDASGKWSLTNSIFFYRKASLSVANVTKAEYYIDNDPGFGYGTPITLTAEADLQNISFTASMGSLPAGIHILFVRSQDANGRWSITNQTVYYKRDTQASASNIIKAEYYIDNDPGFGYAVNIPLTQGVNVQDVNFTTSINSLPVGLHVIFIRSQNANGKWSVTNQLLFYKKDIVTGAASITKAEYYFDNDPGFGYAQNIAITPGTNLVDINFAAGIQNLSVGLHVMSLRSYAAGKWSITNQMVFYKPAPASSGITAVEYYFDSEPGFGQGIPVAINPTHDLQDYVSAINITGLSTGDHKLFLRSKSSNGWSVTNIYTFNISTVANTPFISINGITNTEHCAWASFKISFHSTGNYLPNNVFTVQLSDGNGSFATPVNIGKVTSQASAIVQCALPAHMNDGTNYRIRVISSNVAVTGADSYYQVAIHDRPELGNDTTVFVICANETFNLLPVFNTTGLVSSWSVVTPLQAPIGAHQLVVNNSYGCMDTAVAIVKQDVATWLGTFSNNWHDAANWSTGKVPLERTHAIVPGGTPNTCNVMNANAMSASVQVKSAGVINVKNARILFVLANCATVPQGN